MYYDYVLQNGSLPQVRATTIGLVEFFEAREVSLGVRETDEEPPVTYFERLDAHFLNGNNWPHHLIEGSKGIAFYIQMKLHLLGIENFTSIMSLPQALHPLLQTVAILGMEHYLGARIVTPNISRDLLGGTDPFVRWVSHPQLLEALAP